MGLLCCFQPPRAKEQEEQGGRRLRDAAGAAGAGESPAAALRSHQPEPPRASHDSVRAASLQQHRQSRDDGGALQAQLLPLLRELTAGCHGSTLEQLQNAVALIQERTGAAMAR